MTTGLCAKIGIIWSNLAKSRVPLLHKTLTGNFYVAKCNLGKVKMKTMQSAVASRRGSGETFELSAGGSLWFALHLLAC